MAPTTRSAKAKPPAAPPKRPGRKIAYVLIDKTPRNRLATAATKKAEKDELKKDKGKAEKPKAKLKAVAKANVKAVAKGKGKARVQEPATVEEEDALPPTDPEPIPSDAAGPSLTAPVAAGPATINTPSRLPSPPPSPPRITPRPHPFFPFPTATVPHTPRRHSFVSAPGIRERYPSSLPPSSPIRSSSSPSPVRRPQHALPAEQSFSVYAGRSDPEADLPEEEWGDEAGQEDKENWAVGSEEDKENQFFEDENKENEPLPPQPAEDDEASDDDLFAKGLQDSRDDDRWDTRLNREETMVSAPVEDINPFDVSGSEAILPGGSDKENENENDFEFDLPVATTDHDRGILQPRSPIPSQIEAARIAQAEDPFGFFAAEQRLKERRRLGQPEAGPSTSRAARKPFGMRALAQKETGTTESLPVASQSHSQSQAHSHLPPSTAPLYSDSEIEDLYATPKSTRYAYQTPQKGTGSHVHAYGTAESTVMTPRHDNGREVTMRRRRPKDASVTLAPSEDSSEVPEMESPSPSKARKRSSSGREDAENVEPPTKRARREKGKGKEKENVVDPAEEVRRLEEMLPRRRLGRAAKGKGKARMVEEDDDDDESEEDVRAKKSTRGRSTTRGRGRGRGRGRACGARSRSDGSRGRKKKEESTDEDVREERERARQERIEYFKKLDGYQIHKENVYVI
ncbi:hypothetical protein DENSPDRAFT_843486 [Dentipellis sp. KUC8613]|nr:hypothetical protein DENSPDRAFT_843486 [Dentipellis sp. KUC8613]